MTKYKYYAFWIFAVAGIFSCACGMDQEKKSMSKSAEFAKNLVIGSVTGIAEIVVDQPLIYFKNSFQQGKYILEKSLQRDKHFQDKLKLIQDRHEQNKLIQDKLISFNPRVWYRGFGVNIACTAPYMAVSIAAKEALSGRFPKADIATSTIAGGISTLVISPTELIMLHQQNMGRNVLSTIKQLVAESGVSVLARGITPKVAREGIFGAGFFTAYPWVEEQVRTHVADNKALAIGCGAVIAGGTTAFVSHPFDTLSTFMQKDPKKQKAKTTWQAANTIYNDFGYKGFFKGVTPRATRVCLAIPLMSYVKDYLKAISNHSKQ